MSGICVPATFDKKLEVPGETERGGHQRVQRATGVGDPAYWMGWLASREERRSGASCFESQKREKLASAVDVA